MLSTSSKRVSGGGEESKHFTSLQIFTSYAEPPLNEYLDTEEQVCQRSQTSGAARM